MKVNSLLSSFLLTVHPAVRIHICRWSLDIWFLGRQQAERRNLTERLLFPFSRRGWIFLSCRSFLYQFLLANNRNPDPANVVQLIDERIQDSLNNFDLRE